MTTLIESVDQFFKGYGGHIFIYLLQTAHFMSIKYE